MPFDTCGDVVTMNVSREATMPASASCRRPWNCSSRQTEYAGGAGQGVSGTLLAPLFRACPRATAEASMKVECRGTAVPDTATDFNAGDCCRQGEGSGTEGGAVVVLFRVPPASSAPTRSDEGSLDRFSGFSPIGSRREETYHGL